MNVEEMLSEFRKLSPVDRGTFLDRAQYMHQNLVMGSLRAGATVEFTESRTSVRIRGTFKRMKQKYAEVESEFNRYGQKDPLGRKVRWTVPPSMLRVVGDEAAK